MIVTTQLEDISVSEEYKIFLEKLISGLSFPYFFGAKRAVINKILNNPSIHRESKAKNLANRYGIRLDNLYEPSSRKQYRIIEGEKTSKGLFKLILELTKYGDSILNVEPEKVLELYEQYVYNNLEGNKGLRIKKFLDMFRSVKNISSMKLNFEKIKAEKKDNYHSLLLVEGNKEIITRPYEFGNFLFVSIDDKLEGTRRILLYDKITDNMYITEKFERREKKPIKSIHPVLFKEGYGPNKKVYFSLGVEVNRNLLCQLGEFNAFEYLEKIKEKLRY